MNVASQHPYWGAIARRWGHVGHPLRPCGEDCANFGKLLELGNKQAMRALILGVTPELFHLDWPGQSTVHSVDRSMDMIKAIWPGPEGSASVANWLELPAASDAYDCVLCDGGLHLLDYPHGQRRLSEVLARILRPGGRFVIRLFALPSQPETPSAVFADVERGQISSTHVFKLRLGMALQGSAECGVRLQDVYARVIQRFGDLDRLQGATGWPRDEVHTLASYREAQDTYHFLTVEQSTQVLESSGLLVLESRVENGYPLGERCPQLSFRRI